MVEAVAPAMCAEVGCVGDGVDTAGGNFRSDAKDVLFPSGLFGIEMVRSYRSDNSDVGWFGRGWATAYETTVSRDGDAVVVDAPAGLNPLWAPDAPAGWAVAGGASMRQDQSGLSLTWPSGEEWWFGDGGALRSIRSPYGAEVTIERPENAITLTSTQGVSIDLTLENGQVVAADVSDGRQATYAYAGELLTGATVPGRQLAYRYDADGLLTDVSSPAGSSAVVYVDGKVSSHRALDGQRFAFEYAANGTQVNSIGPVATYAHDGQGRLIRVAYGDHDVLTQAFDADGRVTQRTEFAFPGGQVVAAVERTFHGARLTSETINGVTTEYSYDADGRVTEIGGPASASFEYADDPLPSAVTTPETGRTELTHVDGYLTASTDATGVTSLTTRDALGNPIGTGFTAGTLWAHEFDAEGNVTSTTSPTGRRWTSEWAPRSQLRRERDPLGRTTALAYDAAGRVTRESAQDGSVTERSYNESGHVLSVTDPDGLVTRYEYDTNGRVHTIVAPGDRTWRVGYEDHIDGSQTVTSTAPDATAVITLLDSAGREISRRFVDADGRPVETVSNRYEFDRLVETTVRRGPSSFVTRTSYDDAGRVTAVEAVLDGSVVQADTYEYDAGRIIAAARGDELATYSYDDAGRLIEVVSAADTWSASYRGGQLASTQHNDLTTEIERDADGRPVRYFDARGVTTEWRYDDVDRPLARSVGNATAEFEWNRADQLTSYHAPTGAKWTWAYDAAGRLTAATEPGGANTSYEYALGAVTRIRTSGGGRDRDDRFTYDARGLLRSASTSVGGFNYVYDAAGRISEIDGPRDSDNETWTLNAAGQVTEVGSGDDTYAVTYTTAGQIDRIDGPDDRFLATAWNGTSLTEVEVDGHDPLGTTVDEHGRLASVTWDGDTAVDLTWRGDGSFVAQLRDTDRQVEYTVADGLLTSYESDGTAYRMTGSRGVIDTLALESTEFEGTIQFDAVGRPATLQTSDRTSTITYDSAGRVSSVLTSRPGNEPEQTTVSYDDGRQVEGNGDLVNALFDDAGGLRQSLPNTLPNPLSAGADVTMVQQALLIAGADDLLASEPEPFAQVETAISASSPSLTAPVGVRDLLRLARQLVVAEVSRLAPSVSLGDGLSIDVPIINPDNGELADFNPFVDATPSGLALGMLARQAGGGGSVFDRAVDGLGNIAGGVVSFSKKVARFVTTNPVARLVLAGAVYALPIVCGPAFPACGPAIALVTLGAAAVKIVDSMREIASTCRSGTAAGCGLSLVSGTLTLAEVLRKHTGPSSPIAAFRSAAGAPGPPTRPRPQAEGSLT